jgi:hypothetical protein
MILRGLGFLSGIAEAIETRSTEDDSAEGKIAKHPDENDG